MENGYRPPRACEVVDASILWIGQVLSWLNVFLVFFIMVAIVFRYVLSIGFVWVEELEWHLYSVNVMIGLAYCAVKDSHIRTDVVSYRWSARTKTVIEILGILFLVFPLIIVLLVHGYDFWHESWRLGEGSNAPMGLCCRWLVKAFIPVGILLWGIAMLSKLVGRVAFLIHPPMETEGGAK